MNTNQRAVVLAELDRFDRKVEHSIAMGNRYEKLLEGVDNEVDRIKVCPEHPTVLAQYSSMVDNRGLNRSTVKTKGAPTAVHYTLHLHPAYRAYSAEREFSVAEYLSVRALSLPLHADLNESIRVDNVKALT